MTRNFGVVVAISLCGCSGTDLGREGTALDKKVSSQSSALAPDTNYRVKNPPKSAKWLVLLCYAPGQSPGDTPTYTNLFAKAAAPGNIWDYWNNQSYGAVTNDFDVRGWYATNKTPSSYIQNTIDCVNASGLNPANYWNVVTVYGGLPNQHLGLQTNPTSLNFQCNQNGGCEGQVIADAFSPPAAILHEMGHGTSLDHSYDDTSNNYCAGPGEYGDNWDIMSFDCNVATFNGRYSTPGGGSRMGPGLDAWNRYKLGWLPIARRLYFWPQTPLSGNVITNKGSIRSRSRADLPGQQMFLVPATSTYAYEVEYVSKEGYDEGVGAPVLLIHKFVYGDDHSYIVKSVPNGFQTTQGNAFQDATAGVTIALGPPGTDLTYANYAVSIDTSVNSIWRGSSTGHESATPNVSWGYANLPAGDTVSGALQVGTDADNSPLYVCRTWYYGEQIGKVSHGSCAFPYGGAELWSSSFEYLVTSRPTQLVAFKQGQTIPSNAVLAGFENNTPEYVCAELISFGNGRSGLTPGKVVSWGACDVSYGGNEIFASSYELLIIN